MSVASDVAQLKISLVTLQAQITALQQRIARDEAKILNLQLELSRVKKG